MVPRTVRAVADAQRGRRLGWRATDDRNEHLATAAVIALALETIHAVPALPSAPRLVVATPSGEPHAVGAAISAAAASIDGWSIVYLGPDMPDADIAAAAGLVRDVRGRGVIVCEKLGDLRAELERAARTG